MSEQPLAQSPAIDESHINGVFVWKIAFIAAMGGLLFGYDFMVISGATKFYKAYFGFTDEISLFGNPMGLSVATFAIGCVLGSIFSMICADRYGRKTLLIWASVLFGLSAVGTALAWDFNWFLLFRVVGGIGVGLAANLSPMYIAEISPASYRGKVVTTNQLTIMVGIVVSQIVNLFIQKYGASVPVESGAMSWNETMGWRLMFGAEAIPAIAFFLLMFAVPRSPRWLIKRGRNEEARQVLTMIGGEAYAAQEVKDITSTISQEEVAHTNLSDLLDPRLFKIILLGMFLAITQQWSGLNSIFAYSHQIFEAAGFETSQTMMALVYQGITMLVFCVLAMYIVDRVGRKKLMLLGCAGISVIHLLIGLSFHYEKSGFVVVVLVLVAIAFYAMTLAPIVWVLLSELFPNRIRGVALGISVVALWVGYAILTYTFPIMEEQMGMDKTFWFYSAFLLIAFFVILFALPETKGKSLEQIEREVLGFKSAN